MTFVIKQGDVVPVMQVTLYDGDTPVDLSTAEDVRLFVSDAAGAVIINTEITVADQNDPATRGQVIYEWQNGDTDTVGHFKAEVRVTWQQGRQQTFPSQGYFTIKVVGALHVGPA